MLFLLLTLLFVFVIQETNINASVKSVEFNNNQADYAAFVM